MPAGDYNKIKTHCPKDHPYDEENTKIGSRGQRICKACSREASLSWYHRNKETYYNPERKGSINRRRAVQKHGLTVEEYERMEKAQRGRCKICRRTPEEAGGGRVIAGRERVLHIDHCHDTGKVRGLLCAPCNMAIGLFHHDKKRLSSALAYLGN